MTFLQLQQLTLARLGDRAFVHLGTGEGDIEPTCTDLVILKLELNRAYEDAVRKLARQNFHAVTVWDDVVFSAGQKTKDLSSVPTILSKVPDHVLFIGIYPNNDTSQNPIPATFPFGGSIKKQPGKRYPVGYLSNTAPLDMFTDGFEIGFHNTPTSETTVQVRYAPVITEMSANDDTPSQVPKHHHEYIAQLAAVQIKGGEAKAPQGLLTRLYQLQADLEQVGSKLYKHTTPIAGAWSRICRR